MISMTKESDASALYVGRVMHARLTPFRHRFTYRVFSLWVDLDALPRLDERLRLFGHNRLALFSFHDRDHGPRDGSPLRPWVDAALTRAGLDPVGGSIRVLCFPRVLGYVFNPLSIYFCFDRDERLQAILYEVKNTFGDQHGYLVPVDSGSDHGDVRQSADKGFYVSPFIDMACNYRFRLRVPDERLAVMIRQTSAKMGEILIATQTGSRRALTDGQLLRLFFTHPLMTFKVIVGIHWEAFHLWRKGARFHRRAAAPQVDVTVLT